MGDPQCVRLQAKARQAAVFVIGGGVSGNSQGVDVPVGKGHLPESLDLRAQQPDAPRAVADGVDSDDAHGLIELVAANGLAFVQCHIPVSRCRLMAR